MKILGKIFKRKPKINRKETVLDLICTVLSCWLLSVGTGLILDSQFTIQIGIGAILWQTLAATVAVLLLTRRWWILVIYFGILIPVFFLAISLSGDLISFFKSIASFFSWWFGGMSIESKWYTVQGYYLIHTCMNIGVSIMYFAIARITKKEWISVIVALAFIVANYAIGYTGYNVLTIPFFIVGILPLIAGQKFQNIKLPDFKNMFGILGEKWLMIVVSTFIAILVSLTSLFMLSNTTDSVRNRFCSDIVADVQTATDTFNIDQQKVNITLFDLGLAMNSTYIGGNLYDIEEDVIATTDLTDPARIKVTAFDTYNGQNWINDFQKSYRINGIFWGEEQRNFLSTPLLKNEKFMKDVENIAFKTKINFTMKSDANFLPTVGQVVGFEEKTSTPNPITFDRRGRILSYYGQEADYSYTIESLVYDTAQEITERQMNGLLGDYAFIEDPNYDPNSEFYKLYTKRLGDKLPEELTKALKGLIQKEYNEYEKAYKISTYFSKNGYAYVKKPDTFNKGDNILKKLFSTKHGHCIYYSTAMVAMAREAGIPSRLAAGYVTIPSSDKKTQVIDASLPYAWVECYLPNVGWVSFDPSPQNPQSLSSNYEEQSDVGDRSDNPDIDVETEIEEEETGGTNLKWDTVFNYPLVISLSIVALLIILVIIHTVISQSCYELKRVRKRYKTTEKQANYYYADMLRQYAWLGFRLCRGETISEATERVCGILSPNYVEVLTAAITTVEAMHYGDEEPTDEQVEEICKARRLLENKLKDKNNVFMYIIKRRLLLPTFSLKSHKKLKK